MRFKWKVAAALLLAGLVPTVILLKLELDSFAAYSHQAAMNEIQTSMQLKGEAVQSYVDDVVNLTQSIADLPQTSVALQDMDVADEVRSVPTAVSENSEATRTIAASISKVNDQAQGMAIAATQQGEVTHEIAARMSRTADRVGISNDSLTEVQAASENATRAAGNVLGGVASVEKAAEAIHVALMQFLRRLRTI